MSKDKLIPSKVMNEYRIHYGEKYIGVKNYFEIEVPFEEMDNAWLYAKGIVSRMYASKVSCTTKLSHHYFSMNKAVIAIYPNENVSEDDLYDFMKIVFTYDITQRKVVFN